MRNLSPDLRYGLEYDRKAARCIEDTARHHNERQLYNPCQAFYLACYCKGWNRVINSSMPPPLNQLRYVCFHHRRELYVFDMEEDPAGVCVTLLIDTDTGETRKRKMGFPGFSGASRRMPLL